MPMEGPAKTLRLTCDTRDGLCRTAVWQGKTLRDLYLDRLDRPDWTGAVVIGKVSRLCAKGKAAWCESQAGKIYVENPGNVRSGDELFLRLVTSARQGKACAGVVEAGFASGLEGQGVGGVLTPPPRPWQRALGDLNGLIVPLNGKEHGPGVAGTDASDALTSLVFSDRQAWSACRDWLENNAPALLPRLAPLATESPHPELDDLLDSLMASTVPLLNGQFNGGNIVIETTQALTSIDVNAGEETNPLTVNLQALREAARQIRWRNLSGIIVIDALKSKLRTDSAKLLHALKESTASDPARVDVFGVTKLGLVELVRQRKGPSLQEIMASLKPETTDSSKREGERKA